uniref:Uncharacterized protein n=1 Tax=Glossina austeni TaxID=7395 RepID=A0A1A9UDG9_GLOAU
MSFLQYYCCIRHTIVDRGSCDCKAAILSDLDENPSDNSNRSNILIAICDALKNANEAMNHITKEQARINNYYDWFYFAVMVLVFLITLTFDSIWKHSQCSHNNYCLYRKYHNSQYDRVTCEYSYKFGQTWQVAVIVVLENRVGFCFSGGSGSLRQNELLRFFEINV